MSRLVVHVEGQTEETFVREILRPYLCSRGFESVSARLIGNARQRDRRGGIRSWSSARIGIINHLKQDTTSLHTTMIDYYGLPKTGSMAWPGREVADQLPFEQKAAVVEEAIAEDILNEIEDFFPIRFLPFVMMHEFEALLFSDCEKFGRVIGHPELIAKLQEIRDQFSNPEEINDSPNTAPSKRVSALVEGYQKPLFGAIAIIEIGLEPINRECPHFKEWIENLGNWPSRYVSNNQH